MAVQELSTSPRGRGRGHVMWVVGGEGVQVRVATVASGGGAPKLDLFFDVRSYRTEEKRVGKCSWY